MANILVVDDDRTVCRLLSQIVKKLGHLAVLCHTLAEGLKANREQPFDAVLLDVKLPDGDGLEALPEFRQTGAEPEVIILTGHGEKEGAELAIQSGAWDYIVKTGSYQNVALPLKRVLQFREGVKSRGRQLQPFEFEGIIGKSPVMQKCYHLLAVAADSDLSIHLTGETGTGKEVFARAIHQNSRRKNGNFVVVDCSVLPKNLVEAQLFGHRKGAFTGAIDSHLGLIKMADGGTLFIDEIGELSLSAQKMFLRVLEERTFRRVGGKNQHPVDFRLISATHRDLDSLAEEGKFREDLLYRLRAMVIKLPPLRERKKDLNELIFHSMKKYCDTCQIPTKGISPEFIQMVAAYSWPGNIRELIKAIEHALALAKDAPTLFPVHLPENIRTHIVQNAIHSSAPEKSADGKSPVYRHAFPKLQQLIEVTEKAYLEDLMAFTSGDINEMCRISGVSRARMYVRLKKYTIERPA